jgi:F-type H+-transporting ATPase subunit b
MGGTLNMVGYGLAAIGPGIGVGLVFAAYINGTARQPEMQSGRQPISLFLGLPWPGVGHHRHCAGFRPQAVAEPESPMTPIYLAAEEPGPLNFVWEEFVLVLIIFLLLLWLMSKYVVPMFEKSFEQRRDAIEGGIARAEATQREAAALLRQYQQQLSEVRTEAAQIRDGARAEGQRIVEEMRANAQAESDRIAAAASSNWPASRHRASLRAPAVWPSSCGRIFGERLATDAAVRSTVDAFLASRRSKPGRVSPDDRCREPAVAGQPGAVDSAVRSAQDDALEGIAGEPYAQRRLAAQPLPCGW